MRLQIDSKLDRLELPRRTHTHATSCYAHLGRIPKLLYTQQALPVVAAYTGLRWGELAGLRIADIDMLRRRLTVRSALIEAAGEAPRLGRPKTAASERTITLPGIALDAIAQHIDRHPLVEGMMWTTERGAYLRRGSFSRIWRTAAQERPKPPLENGRNRAKTP